MAGEGHRLVVDIAETGVGSGRQNDVHTAQQRGQSFLVTQLLQVSHQDHLVHALADQVVDHRLQLAGQQRHVVSLGAVTSEALHLHATSGGNLLNNLSSGTNQANLFAVLGHHSRGHNSPLLRRCFFQAGAACGVAEAGIQICIGTEVEVGGEVGELGSDPAGHRSRREGIPKHPRTEIEFVVTDRGGFHADQVVDGDVHRANRMVGASGQADGGTGYGVELIAHAQICAAIQEGARDEVVAAGKDQGVRVGAIKAIHQGR